MPSHFFALLRWGSDGFQQVMQCLCCFEQSDSDLLSPLSSNVCGRRNLSVPLTPVGSSLGGNQV